MKEVYSFYWFVPNTVFRGFIYISVSLKIISPISTSDLLIGYYFHLIPLCIFSTFFKMKLTSFCYLGCEFPSDYTLSSGPLVSTILLKIVYMVYNFSINYFFDQKFLIKIMKSVPVEMAQWLGLLAVLTRDQGSGPIACI